MECSLGLKVAWIGVSGPGVTFLIDSLLERKIEKRPDKVRLQGRILFLSEDPELIKKRAGHGVPIPPGGTLSDYVPFYFTPLSPMLYNIQTGRNGTQRPSKDEIVILVSSLHKIAEELYKTSPASAGQAGAASAGAGAGGSSSSGGQEQKKPGDVIDAEYVDVDDSKKPN